MHFGNTRKSTSPARASNSQTVEGSSPSITVQTTTSFSSSSVPSNTGVRVTLTNARVSSTVLLATILLEVRDKFGNDHTCRALCDFGAQSSFPTERCFRRLGLTCTKSLTPLIGLSQVTFPRSYGSTTCSICPMGCLDLSFTLECIILKNISTNLPTFALDSCQFASFGRLKLADTKRDTPVPIYVLLDADICPRLLRNCNQRSLRLDINWQHCKCVVVVTDQFVFALNPTCFWRNFKVNLDSSKN